VHTADGEVCLTKFLSKPVDLSASVAEDDGLGDGQRVVQITPDVSARQGAVWDRDSQSVVLPILLLNGNKELLDTLKSQLITLDENSDGVSHKLGGHFQHIGRERSRYDDDLGRGREVSVDIVDLVFETFVEQLVGFIKDEDLGISKRVTCR